MAKTYGTVTTFTAGSVLTAAQLNVASTAINNLVAPCFCKVIRSTDVAHPGTGTGFSWSSAEIDTDSMYAAGSPTRITINTAGIYVVNAMAYITNTTKYTTAPTLRVYKNGTAVASIGMDYQNDGYVSVSGNVTTLLNLAAADYLELSSTFGGGGTITVSGNLTSGRTEMSASWIGRTA